MLKAISLYGHSSVNWHFTSLYIDIDCEQTYFVYEKVTVASRIFPTAAIGMSLQQ